MLEGMATSTQKNTLQVTQTSHGIVIWLKKICIALLSELMYVTNVSGKAFKQYGTISFIHMLIHAPMRNA